MSILLTNVTGGAQTGLTTPGYTVTTDVAPDINGRQYVVTALTGTQTGVRVHSVSDPFSIVFYRPKVMKALPVPNPITGRYGALPRNTYGIIVRKGVNFAANQPPDVMITRVTHDIPTGADAYDQPNIRASESLLVGALNQQSAGLGDMFCNGVI